MSTNNFEYRLKQYSTGSSTTGAFTTFFQNSGTLDFSVIASGNTGFCSFSVAGLGHVLAITGSGQYLSAKLVPDGTGSGSRVVHVIRRTGSTSTGP